MNNEKLPPENPRETLINERSGTQHVRLFQKGGTVVFEYHNWAEWGIGEWWDVTGKFSIKAYQKGIQELKEKGHCVISEKGSKRGVRLEMEKDEKGTLSVYFQGLYRGVVLPGRRWDIEKLTL